MGKVVTNLYGGLPDTRYMSLEIVSSGIYNVEVLFDAQWYEYLSKYRWCFEQTKLLVYCMDLTMDLPQKMGYSTPRIYLRDYIPYLNGHWKNGKCTVKWKRAGYDDYKFDISNTKAVVTV